MADFINAFRDIETPETLHPCSKCGRKFNGDTVERHENICLKLKKRKPFDSSKQRTSDIPGLNKQKGLNPTDIKPKKNNWKEKHEDFINTVRSARGLTAAIKKGGPLPPTPPQRIDPDLVQCPHCSRRFNQHSVERHIQFCKDQKSRIAKSPGSASSIAAQRVAARTKYKPPSLVKRPPSGTSLSSNAKTRQPKTKTANTTHQASRYDDQPLPVSNQGSSGGSKVSPHSATKKNSKQTVQGRQRTNATDTTSGTLQGQQSTYNSSRYKTKGNYMETIGFEYEREMVKPKEVKYGRRASKTHESNSPAENMTTYEDGLDYSHSSNLKHNIQVSKCGRRNIAIRDATPTLFDDFSVSDQPSSLSEKNPFPPKAQVHRPSAGELHNNYVDEQRRLSKFCHECGTKYPVANAKFCCECGTKRLHITN